MLYIIIYTFTVVTETIMYFGINLIKKLQEFCRDN